MTKTYLNRRFWGVFKRATDKKQWISKVCDFNTIYWHPKWDQEADELVGRIVLKRLQIAREKGKEVTVISP